MRLTGLKATDNQQAATAFPDTEAGFSAYYRLCPAPACFSGHKAELDRYLFSVPGNSQYRSGAATLLEMGDNFTIGIVPVQNIDSLTTSVHLYYDDDGWIVAYFPANTPSAQAWQARQLTVEEPQLEDVSHTVLLDAINEVVASASGLPPLTPDELGYYHWQYPEATNFLMLATARGKIGSDLVSFALPASFEVKEVSVSLWVSLTPGPCAHAALDTAEVIAPQCQRSFAGQLVDLNTFNSRSGHTLEHEHLDSDTGASGAMVMLVYAVPDGSPEEITLGDPIIPILDQPDADFGTSFTPASIDAGIVPQKELFSGNFDATYQPDQEMVRPFAEALAETLVTGRVKLQGRDSSRGGLVLVEGETYFVAEDGSFTVPVTSGKRLELTISAPGYVSLRISAPELDSGQTLNLNQALGVETLTLLAGDLDGDGDIDAADLAVVGRNLAAQTQDLPIP